jgi:hypothetical protein
MNHPDQSQGSEETKFEKTIRESAERWHTIESLRSELSKKDEEEFGKIRTTFHEMNKRLMNEIIAKDEEIKQLKEALKEYNAAVDYSRGYQMWASTKQLDKVYNKARKLLEK